MSEDGSSPLAVGISLQLTGNGTTAGDFTWAPPGASTPPAESTPAKASAVAPVLAAPVINEFGFSDAGADNEFVELFGDPDADYSAYTFLHIEGDAGGGTGVIDEVVTAATTDSGGLWVSSVAPSFENGSSSLLLVEGFTGSPGDDLDVDDDGTLETTPWTAVVDAVAVNDGDAGDIFYATPVLDESFDDGRLDNPFSPGGASRFPDGNDTDGPLDWYRNDFDWDGVTNGSPVPGEALNTPGAPNELVAGPAPEILINEVDADQAGNDSAEFVELTDGGAGSNALDGLVLVFYNGANDQAYAAFDLDGSTTGADGYFVLCGDAANVANCDLDVTPNTNLIQNGADAVALYTGDAADFPDGTPLTTDALIDAVVYDTSDADDAELLTLLTAGGQLDEGANGDQTGHSNSRCPDSSGAARDTTTFDAVTPSPGATNTCDGGGGPELRLIHEIQGAGAASPLDGQQVIISGIVVGDFQAIVTDDPVNDEPLDGFFVQEEDLDADADPATSEGIFVFAPGAVDVAVGDLVEVTGRVDEFFGLTEITAVTGIDVVSSDNPLPTPAIPTVPTAVGDPLVDWEAIEGMAVTFNQPLFVTGLFPLGALGEVQLSAIGAQDHPNQVNPVGSTAAAEQAQLNIDSRVILEDGEDENETFPSGIPTWNPEPTPFLGGAESTLRSGDVVNNLTGVVNYAFGEYEVVPVNVADPTDPDGAVSITRTPRPVGVPAVGGDLVVVGFNVLNYFVTFDEGSNQCGPPGFEQGCRGADNQAEFDLQSTKIATAIAAIDADIVGLIELENSANDEAVADLVAKVNAISGRSYTYVPTGYIGTDAIAVGFMYDTATVATDGPFAILDSSVSPAFIDDKNRPALAQTFLEVGSGERVTIAVNHLKSKGSDCLDVDNPGDPAFGVAPYGAGVDIEENFQGNCNLTREAAATVLGQWLAADPTGTGATNTMVLGDLNAYANESPVTVLEGQGYVDLTERFAGGNSWAVGGHSFVFDGEHGTLDYAMANAALLPQVTGAAAWHINADEPFAIDYNDFNPPGQATPDEWKSSDHDPIIIGLELAPSEPVLACAGVEGTRADLEAAGYNVIVGTEGRDVLRGTSASDFILGLGGRDSLSGRGGDDVVCGGDGRDSIWVGPGADVADGEGDRDWIFGGSGSDSLWGGAGPDRDLGWYRRRRCQRRERRRPALGRLRRRRGQRRSR